MTVPRQSRWRRRLPYFVLGLIGLIGVALMASPFYPSTDDSLQSVPKPITASQEETEEPQQLEAPTASGGIELPALEGVEVAGPSDTPVSGGPAPRATTEPQPTHSEAPLVSPVVTMSEPTHISIPEIGYEAEVGQMTTDSNSDVDPPTKELTYRVTDRGSQPGEDADNTVYLACHSASRSNAPCNAVYQNADEGQIISLTTETGQLEYKIESIETLSKNGEFENSEMVRAKVPGRLVLVTCLQRGPGLSSRENFVVFAQLVEK